MSGEEFRKLLRRLHHEGGIPDFKGLILDTGEEIKFRAYALFGYERGEKFPVYYWYWSMVALTNRRLILRPGMDDNESELRVRDFRLEDPNFVCNLSEHPFKFKSGFLNRVTVYYRSLLLNDRIVVVKDADRWKEEIRQLQHARRKEYAEELLNSMSDAPEEILLDPNEEVIRRGVGVVRMNFNRWARVYLTSRRLITKCLPAGFKGLEHIIGLERIYRIRVDYGGLEIDYRPVGRHERGGIFLKFWSGDIEHWKNEIVRLRNIRIKRIEDH